jgi:HSP20 family protein
MERSFGSFSRTFTLPDEVEAGHIHAEIKDGVLGLSIPKRPESKPQKVKIQS